MNRFYVAKALRTKVTAQARYRCGYCLTSQEYSGAFLEIEHLVPLKLGGPPQKKTSGWLAVGVIVTRAFKSMALIRFHADGQRCTIPAGKCGQDTFDGVKMVRKSLANSLW